jgi:hypothetical protein
MRRRLGRNREHMSRRPGARLKRRAQHARMMNVSAGGTVITIGGVQVTGERKQPPDDAEHRERDDAFLDAMCEMHSGGISATCDALDLIPGSARSASSR